MEALAGKPCNWRKRAGFHKLLAIIALSDSQPGIFHYGTRLAWRYSAAAMLPLKKAQTAGQGLPRSNACQVAFVGKRVYHPMIQASFRIVAPENKRDEILNVLMCLKGPTEVSRGCRACRILQDVEGNHVLTYLVQWDTQDEIEEHLRSERFRRLLPYIDMSLEPPEVTFSTIVKIQGIEFLINVLSSPSR